MQPSVSRSTVKINQVFWITQEMVMYKEQYKANIMDQELEETKVVNIIPSPRLHISINYIIGEPWTVNGFFLLHLLLCDEWLRIWNIIADKEALDEKACHCRCCGHIFKKMWITKHMRNTQNWESWAQEVHVQGWIFLRDLQDSLIDNLDKFIQPSPENTV